MSHSWKPYTFFPDPIIYGKKYFAGSAAVTTAICLEAIGKYLTAVEKFRRPHLPQKAAVQKIPLGTAGKNILQKIVKQAEQRLSLLDGDLKKLSLQILKKTLKNDNDSQITLLPYYFKNALGKNAIKITDDFLVQLGLANLYGWIAYTIYDDFLDEEGDPKILAVANVATREAVTIYHNIIPKKTGFHSFLKSTMDTLEAANTWEATNCRLKISDAKINIPKLLPDYEDYSKLAERSLGHALGPTAILFLLGYKENSPAIKNLMAFFRHYIIARQLNDDAHDWEKDLKKGQIDSVGVLMLKKYDKRSINLTKDLTSLQQTFWQDIAAEVCEEVLKQIKLAKKSLQAISIITKTSLFEKLLAPIEHSAHQALKEREETMKFLKTYKS